MRAQWYVSDFNTDIKKCLRDPSPENGDGRIYIVRNILGEYLVRIDSYGWTSWSTSKKNAKKFYEGQAAWGAARKSIYPTEVLVIGRVKK